MKPRIQPGDYATFICPLCDGRPNKYWAYNIKEDRCVEVNETTYKLLPKTEEQALKKRQKYCQWEVEKCEHCDGKGEVYICIEELYEQDLEMQRDLRFE